jgi:hypothetical protein
MRPRAFASAVLCLLAGLAVACQSRLVMPTSTALPSHTSTPTSEPLPTITPTLFHTTVPTRTPTPFHTYTPALTPSPLTEAEAIALIKEEAEARGVALPTLRISIEGEPRWVSIRYSSSYSVDSRVFQPQTVLIALAAARVLVRVQPPIDGGIRLAVIPGGESEVGLKVTVIDGPNLEAWGNGSISYQEFVGQWMVWTVTRE